MRKESYSDQEIIAEIQAGGIRRERATETLRKAHIGLAFHAPKEHRGMNLSPEKAMDLFMEALAKTLVNIELGRFKGDSKLSTYLITIFRRCIANEYEEQKRGRNRIFNDSEMEIPAHLRSPLTQNPEKILEFLLVKDQIKQQLDEMGEPCKSILLLAADGYSNAEIAQTISFTQDSVKVRKSQCRSQLRKRLFSNKKM